MLLCYYVITKKTFLFNHFFNNTTIYVYETYSKKPKDTTSPFPFR